MAVQFAATSERVTGRYLVLVVALSTSRWGRHFRRITETGGATSALSPREREIAHLVALGNTGREIAEELQISHETVRKHIGNAMTKLEARSRAHLVAKVLADGAALGDL